MNWREIAKVTLLGSTLGVLLLLVFVVLPMCYLLEGAPG